MKAGLRERIEEWDQVFGRLGMDTLRNDDRELLMGLVTKEVKRLNKLITIHEASKRKRLQMKLIMSGGMVPPE